MTGFLITEDMPQRELVAGTCCVCGCTEHSACAGGCSWVDASRTVCDQCALPCAGCGQPILMGDPALAAYPNEADPFGLGERFVMIVDADGESRNALHVKCVERALEQRPRIILTGG